MFHLLLGPQLQTQLGLAAGIRVEAGDVHSARAQDLACKALVSLTAGIAAGFIRGSYFRQLAFLSAVEPASTTVVQGTGFEAAIFVSQRS